MRKEKKGIDLMVALPWPVGIACGIVGFLIFRYGISWALRMSGNQLLVPMSEPFAATSGTMFGWFLLILCWIGALFSFLGNDRRKQLLDTQTGLESLRTMNWRQFETLVGEAFRRQGYQVEVTGGGGADGGIDLKLRKNGRLELVQCKQWRTRHVDVVTVRAMWGLVMHERADAVKIVCIGDFTPDAKQFAKGKAIDLVSGEKLLGLIRAVQTASHAMPTGLGDPDSAPSRVPAIPAPPASPSAATQTQSRFAPPSSGDPPKRPISVPACPACGAAMLTRTNRTSGQPFLGCSAYPKCRGTRQIAAQPVG